MKTWWLVNSYVIIFSTSLPWIEDHEREEKFRWKFSHLINYPSRRTKIVPVSVAIIPRRISEQGSPKHRDHWLRKNKMEINYIYIFANIQKVKIRIVILKDIFNFDEQSSVILLSLSLNESSNRKVKELSFAIFPKLRSVEKIKI